MPTTLLCLHGFTMHGAGLRRSFGPLQERLGESVELVFPDAPGVASEESVAGLAAYLGGWRAAAPHLEWWNASEDRSVYHGWEASREALRREAERHSQIAVLGFSQGAGVAAALAGEARRGAFPPLRFVVLVAGFAPRAADIAPLFDPALEVPSLHIYGDADPFAKYAPGLAECFAPATRRVVNWPGPHAMPQRGPAAEALVEFVHAHA
jgi:pimeloyl-ACP methyl ester carboxylesterase